MSRTIKRAPLRRAHRLCFTSFTLALAGLSSPSAHAADDSDAVVVTATRQQQRANELLADVSAVTRRDIEQAGASTLTELLSRQPGLQMISNGGAGKSSAIYIRGAEARHTLVLVDGMRVGSATLGTTSLEALPLAQIERIEILRGPASSLYGADAIGGVIQIFTRSGKGAPKADAFIGYGSYNSKEVSAGYSGEVQGLQFSLRADENQTDGFSAVRDRVKQPNYYQPDSDGYRNRSLSASLGYRFDRDNDVSARLFSSLGENHYDSFKTAFDSRLNEQVHSFNLQSRNRINPVWQSIVRIGAGADEQNTYATSDKPTTIRSDQTQFSWQNDLTLPLGKGLVALERLEQKVSGNVNYTLNSRSINSLLLGWTGAWQAHRWQANVRRDDNSQFGAHTTGALSYGYQFNDQWRAHGSYGTAYNAPTFNQLYYPGYGVPTLKPEFAHNREVGLNWEEAGQGASLVYFDNHITDLITTSTPPMNLNKARITGWSLGYRASHADWHWSASLDLQQPRDELTQRHLARRADQSLNLSADKTLGALTVGGEIQAVGKRYDDVANTNLMGGYTVFNLTARYRLAPEWALELRGNNLTDRKYETTWGFGTAGASVFVGLRYAPL